MESENMKNRLTRNGLTGNTGLGVMGMFHISANYAAGKGKCFIQKSHKEWGLVWQRMTLARAKKEGRKIITCAKCKRPAISIDHHWPCENEHNYCERHSPKK